MSNVNIRRAVEHIRTNTTVYTPLVEVVVNAIQAIDAVGRKDGRVIIRAVRGDQPELDGGLPDIIGFEIIDNGVGFNDDHRKSFDTLYSDLKIKEGGKGFGRFTCLKYFNEFKVISVFKDGKGYIERSFFMGKHHEIIVDQKDQKTDKTDTGSMIQLSQLKPDNAYDKKLITIARVMVEKLLPYFITDKYECPTILLCESDGSDEICLNKFVSNELSAVIREIPVSPASFSLTSIEGIESFTVRVFKVYSPRNQKSKISLVAHKREVSGSAVSRYIPEFEEEFYDKGQSGEIQRDRNYVIKSYVFGSYLDRYVSLERAGFEFSMERDLAHGIGQIEIERNAAIIARNALGGEITGRQEKKRDFVRSYVEDDAPWHKDIFVDIDLSNLPYKASKEEIEIYFQREKLDQDIKVKRGVQKILENASLDGLRDNIADIVNKISGSGKNDLIHYIAMRRNVLDLFAKSLKVNKETGKYDSEGVVHDIIFPRKGDTLITEFKDHNLWILDERLNFTSYVSSDLPLNGGRSERPDLLAYDKRVLFRGDNEPSNPITIFEFKKPQRDDFVNPSSPEDPVQQIVRYVNDIRDGKFKTPDGLKILVTPNTPFYGYVVCDLSTKVETWLEREKDFKPMPDRLGWFHWQGNINLYIEVLSWQKVIKDANMRNQIFFKKLGI